MSEGMSQEQALQQLDLIKAADAHVDQRLDRTIDRMFRATDQTLNGTIRSFLRENALLRQLPFPQSESGSD